MLISVRYTDGQRSGFTFIKLFNDNQRLEKQLVKWSLYVPLKDKKHVFVHRKNII
jgi:hypothetical protein